MEPDCVERIRATTNGGSDHAFEMAGSDKAMELAYRVTRRGAMTVTAGLSDPHALFSVSHLGIVGEERTVTGSYLRSAVPARDIARFIEWLQDHRPSIN